MRHNWRSGALEKHEKLKLHFSGIMSSREEHNRLCNEHKVLIFAQEATREGRQEVSGDVRNTWRGIGGEDP